MTPYEHAVKAGGELAESVQEVIDNLKSVRGEVFSNAVAAAFEARQLADVLARIANENRTNEFAVSLTMAGIELGASIASKTIYMLSDADVEEVIKLADQLHERRMRLMRRAQKGE